MLNACPQTRKGRMANALKNRALLCSHSAYVKIRTLQCVSQVARRQGCSRRAGLSCLYRQGRGVGQAGEPTNIGKYSNTVRLERTPTPFASSELQHRSPQANSNTVRLERRREAVKTCMTDRCLVFSRRLKFILSARPTGSRRARHERIS